MSITLATLSTATAQQVFEQVRDHLLRQMKRSMEKPSGRHCAYRSHDGLSCAAGCLIGDDEYQRSMEGQAWRPLVERGAVPSAHSGLIRAPQDSLLDGATALTALRGTSAANSQLSGDSNSIQDATLASKQELTI